MRVKRGETSILATDFSGLEEERKIWEADRNSKIQIWRSYQERILLLEGIISNENNVNYKWFIEKEIKKLKKQQKKFQVEPIISFTSDKLEQHVKVKKKKRV